MSELFGIAGFSVLVLWFAVPFLIAVGYLAQLAIYDLRIGNYGVSPAKYFERKKNRRKEDEKYDLLCKKGTKWWVITAIWWTISFFMVGVIFVAKQS